MEPFEWFMCWIMTGCLVIAAAFEANHYDPEMAGFMVAAAISLVSIGIYNDFN